MPDHRVVLLLLAQPLLGGPFEDTVRPLLAQRCVSCHGESLQMAGLRLDQFSTEREALREPGVWDDVLRMTRTRRMPPPGSPRPSKAELQELHDWIESRGPAMAVHRKETPGRVTARRLNRAEYNNTVRDLLGVDLRPADRFPVDDSGYGFDNNGDVLSVSPLLMEKYLEAAGRLSRAAVWDGPRWATPTRFRIEAARTSDSSAAIGHLAPFTHDGSLRLTHVFPAKGFYDFAFSAVDRRHRAADGRYLADREPPPPRLMTMTVDGRRMATKAVEAAPYFDRSEQVRHLVEAGTSEIWLGFIDTSGQPVDPNSEFQERKLWADRLEITGPYEAEPVPLPPSHRRILHCRPEGEEPWRPCAESIVVRMAERAFRRPPTPTETADLMRLVDRSMRAGETFEGVVQSMLQAILVSPHFLFRIERRAAPGPSGDTYMLGSFELASRLSYFLWSTMPDEELLEAARSGDLSSPGGLSRQAVRMLGDARANALVENFGGQWLQLRNLTGSAPDPEVFSGFDDRLRESMRRETALFFQNIVQEDRSILDLLDSDYTYLDGRLADHYGIRDVAGDEFRRVALSDGQRGGLLGHGSILTLTSYPTRTSPVLRGLWVLDTILGQAPPPPPEDVPELEEGDGPASGSLREQLEAHRSNGTCLTCHRVMDAIGFGLENYDAVGRWRSTEGGRRVDSSGTLPGGRSFESPAQLRRTLLETEADSFSRNLTRKLLTYALGRGVDRSDNPAVDAIQTRLRANGYRFSALVEGIVTSVPFRMASAAP